MPALLPAARLFAIGCSFLLYLDRFENFPDIALWQMPIFGAGHDQILVFLIWKVNARLGYGEINLHCERLIPVTIKKNMSLFTLI